jgi:hypothetical protein
MGLAMTFWRWVYTYRHTAIVIGLTLYAMALSRVV